MVWGLTVYSLLLLSCESLGLLYLIVLRCQANLGLNSCSIISQTTILERHCYRHQSDPTEYDMSFPLFVV
ncbi:hypothetical protein APLC1_0966 [Limnospira platensis C1]|nr:hypothetical protein APLC1_0966 [Arthrospira platensis C1]